MKPLTLFTALMFVVVSVSSLMAQTDPLPVYILVGQSNMQGHAHVRTLPHLAGDPATKDLLSKIVDEEGVPIVHDQIWISYLSGNGVKAGKLSTGFGADENKIGPELSFGIRLFESEKSPILLIKTAWGGKSLNTDFRSPSAGPYPFSEQQKSRFESQGKDFAEIKDEKDAATGKYYRDTVEHVRTVLADISSVYPDYDAAHGYELKGLVWFQGWNDMVDSGTYPERGKPNGYAAYSDNLAHLIRDFRKDLNAPNLPVVIGVMGVGGPTGEYGESEKRYQGIHQGFRDAMAAPADLPEFKGNVAAVLTERYWDPELKELATKIEKINAFRRTTGRQKQLTAKQREERIAEYTRDNISEEQMAKYKMATSNAAFHYLGSAKILTQIGRGFAEAMIELQKK